MESGRSMIEMLGVLAVVAVLTIGGITGYNYAVNKHKANVILNDVNARAVDIATQYMRSDTGKLTNDGWPEKSQFGYTFKLPERVADGFILPVSDIPQKVCQDLISRELSSPLIDIDGTPATKKTCQDGITLEFYFAQIQQAELQDGCTPEKTCGRYCCGDSESCQDGRCRPICDSNQYFDSATGRCISCPSVPMNVYSAEGCSLCYPAYHWNEFSCCPPTVAEINYTYSGGDNYRGPCYACGGMMTLTGQPPSPCVDRPPTTGCDECPAGSKGPQYCKDKGHQCENRTPDKCVDVSLNDFKTITITYNGVREKWYQSKSIFNFWDAENACAAVGLPPLTSLETLRNIGKNGRTRLAHLADAGLSGPYLWTNTIHSACVGYLVPPSGPTIARQRDYGGGKRYSDSYTLCGPVF